MEFKENSIMQNTKRGGGDQNPEALVERVITGICKTAKQGPSSHYTFCFEKQNYFLITNVYVNILAYCLMD